MRPAHYITFLMRPALYEIKCYHQFGPLLSNLSRYLIVYTGDYSYLTLSGRQKKILSNFHQNFTSSLSMYMEFKSVGTIVKYFFVSKIGHFIQFLIFLTVHKHIIFNLCHFLQLKESKLSNSNLFEFFQYHFPFRK